MVVVVVVVELVAAVVFVVVVVKCSNLATLYDQYVQQSDDYLCYK